MFRWLSGIVFVAVAAALVAISVVWYVDRPNSYDECVVAEMRGQTQATMSVVERMCAVRFHKEDELPLSYLRTSLDVQMLPDFEKDPGVVMSGSKNFKNPPWVFTITKNETSYDVTRIKIKYSHKWIVDCKAIADEDWHDGPDLIFKNKVANVNMPGEYDSKTGLHVAPFCWQYTKIFGTPRKQ